MTRSLNPIGAVVVWTAALALLGGMARADKEADGDTPPQTPQEAARTAPSFTLPDAQEGMTRIKWPRDKVVYLSIGDQGGSSEVQAWAAAVKKRFGDHLEYVSVAWLEAIPDALKGTVKAIIKRQYEWVLMDWAGTVADRYDAAAGKANVYLIDTDGTILVHFAGKVTDERLDEVNALVTNAEKKEEAAR